MRRIRCGLEMSSRKPLSRTSSPELGAPGPDRMTPQVLDNPSSEPIESGHGAAFARPPLPRRGAKR